MIGTGRDGHAVIHCRAGCKPADVLRAFGLGLRHLYGPPYLTPQQWLRFAAVDLAYPPLRPKASARHDPTFRLESIHDYGPDFRLERWRNVARAKDLRWFRNLKGELVPGLLGRHTSDLPLYRERDVGITAVVGEPLHVVESESSVDALNRAGHYATTWAGGAGSPPLDKLHDLLDEHPDCRVVADHDEAGIAVAKRMLAVLSSAAGWIAPTRGHDVRDVPLAGDRRLRTLAHLPDPTPGKAWAAVLELVQRRKLHEPGRG